MTPSALSADLTRRAETLWERLGRLSEAAPQAPASDRENHLRELLGPWSKAVGRGSFEALSRRLGWDGTRPEHAALAFSLPEALPEPLPAPWTAELARYVEEARTFAAEIAEGGPDPHRRQGATVPFMELWLPWVRAASASLGTWDDGALDEITPPALAELESHLLAEIAQLSELAAYELFEARRGTGTGPGLYRRFVADVLEDPLSHLYLPFPVLARQTAETVREWREGVAQLARRLAADRPAIAETFGRGRPPGEIRTVKAGLSDRHRGGRQVLVLGFESGLRVVYKPRSVLLEQALGRFFDRLAAAGLPLRLRAPQVLARRDPGGREYGWEELVIQDRLHSREEAADYYRRAGALAAVAYVLRAHDLHAENLVATRDGPVIVDAEMFLQPPLTRVMTDVRAAGAGPRSCLESGLLTQPERGPSGEIRELGGLRARSPVRSSRSSRLWQDVNSDRMSLAAGELSIEPRENAVYLGERLAPPEEFRDELAFGFEQAYRFLLDRRQAFLADSGPLDVFRAVSVRVLFRRSQDYWTVLALSAMPRHQRSGLSASLLREALLQVFLGHGERPLLWPLVADERAALEARDVPYFAVHVTGTELRSASGEPVEGYLASSGLEAVRARLADLSEEDLERQLHLLRGVLEPAASLPWLAAAPSPPAAELARRGLESRCRELAGELGEDLLGRLAASGLPESPPTLGHGRLGTALFLAALARTDADERFARAALGLARPGRAAARELGLGGFSGLGSVVYGLTWLARLVDDASLVGLARQAARRVGAEAIRTDRAFDLLGGAAGALLGLLALAEATGDEEALDRARTCGEHLAGHQELLGSAGAAWRNTGGVALAGWAHGASGIARALAALDEAAGETRYRAAAAAALGYERSLYDGERRNWPVLAPPERGGKPRRGWMTAWCHGAPGIALARLLLPESFADAALAAELAAALDTTAAAPLGGLDHLCCGAFGRSAVLLTAGQRLGSAERLRQARETAARALDRASADGRFHLRRDPPYDPGLDLGFLKGLAGVGYQLLRLSGAAELPDVLALELPGECRHRSGEPRSSGAVARVVGV